MKTKHIILLVLALLTISFFGGRYSTSRVRNAQYDEISQLTEVMTVYQREVNGREQTIYEKNQLIGTQKEAIEAGLIEGDLLKALNLKKASQITNLEANLAAARDSIDLSGDSIVFVTDTIVGSGEAKNTYVQIPFSWEYTDEWLTLKTGINANRQGEFDLNAKVPISITLGGKNGKQVAAVTTPSPYISITDFNVVRLKQENWYYKPAVPAIGGAIGGLGLGWLIWGR